MGWQAAVVLNGIIAGCYVVISFLIARGLLRTRQLKSNPLAVATAAIFLTCAVHHFHHAAHLVVAFGEHEGPNQLLAIRAVFGEWHTVAIDGVGALIAMTYLGLRHNYKALLNTPQMFDDSVRRAAEQRLRELAFTDLLTGIPNRAAYQLRADELIGDDRSVAVLFIDLDGFKGVNDQFGHDVGDRVLHEVAQVLVGALGENEHVFRLGGDEMIILGVGHDGSAAADLFGRVTAAIRQPVRTRSGDLLIEGSIGVATGRASRVDELLRVADSDMYRIKAARQGRVGVPPPRRHDAADLASHTAERRVRPT